MVLCPATRGMHLAAAAIPFSTELDGGSAIPFSATLDDGGDSVLSVARRWRPCSAARSGSIPLLRSGGAAVEDDGAVVHKKMGGG
uniref:Uncharacterized protein n=1 Tax=Oryza meridionalis TaxID=40149 RepID=A0A0E0DRR2_9ORYZ